jgi:DNA-binding response OmpR family regulator
MKGNVLVVDDEPSARNSLAEILRLEGYRVITADSGEAALKQLENDDFDVMILDLKMPGMGGLGVLKKVGKVAPDTHIILLTAHGSMESAIEAVRHSAHDYLLKPTSPNEILASVSQAMSRRSDSVRKRRLLEQMETSLQQLKDAEGMEQTAPVSSAVLSLGGGVKVDLDRREIWQDDKKTLLTPTEGKLLKVLLENQGRVLSHRELVFLVQGYQTTDWEAPEILRPLVSRLRRKLSMFPGGKDWINNVRGTGYVFDGAYLE